MQWLSGSGGEEEPEGEREGKMVGGGGREREEEEEERFYSPGGERAFHHTQSGHECMIGIMCLGNIMRKEHGGSSNQIGLCIDDS
jgi:hypothetical protein